MQIGKKKAGEKDSKQKKSKKRALGKGLDALFPDIGLTDKPQSTDFFQCDVDKIKPNPYQPRRHFSEEEMKELADSVKARGLLQPLLVRKSKDGYELIAGERRLRAAKMANLFQVPVMLKKIKDGELLELSIIENIQRENLNPLEEAQAYLRLVDEFKLTQEKVAKRVGKSRSAVANFLRLNQLSDDIKATINDGTVSMGHARALLGAETNAIQKKVWLAVVSKGLSVRETEKWIQVLNTQKNASGVKPQYGPENIHFLSIEEDLARYFGTRVQIKRRGKKGKVEIEFYGDDDLDRLLNLLKTTGR